MSNTALPPHIGGWMDWHIGDVPPPHSSENSSLVASLLNVAECQNANAGSATSSRRLGFATFLVSRSSPLPEHAPPSNWWNGKLVTSWQPAVGFGLGSPVPWRRPWRLARTPVFASAKMYAWLTTSDFSGFFSGTLITSMPNVDVCGALGSDTQPAFSSADLTRELPET